MNSRALLVLVAALLAALLAWLLLREQPPEAGQAAMPDAPARTEAGTQASHLDSPPEAGGVGETRSEVALRAALGSPATFVERDCRVRVRSSVGLPLEWVEMRSSDGLWRPHSCVGGVATLRVRRMPLELRAPGHAQRSLELLGKPEDEVHDVVLDPESLLVLADPAHCIAPLGRPGARGGLSAADLPLLAAHGRVHEGSYAIAFDSSRLEARGLHVFELALPLETGEKLECKVHLSPSLLAEGTVPEELSRARRAELAVRVGGPARGRGPWTLRLTDSGVSIDAWIRRQASDHIAGSLETLVRPLDDERESALGRWTFPDLTLERDYTYAAFDLATGAHAIGTLRHTGDPIELTLLPGCIIAGRLSATGGPLPTSVSATIEWRPPASRVRWREMRSLWNSQVVRAVRVGHDGRFEFAGRSASAAEGDHAGQASLSLQIDAPGFALSSVEREVEIGTRHDLGVIELVQDAPWLTIAPGHGIDPARIHQHWLCALDTQVGVERLELREDGSLAVHAPQLREIPGVLDRAALQWIERDQERGHLFLKPVGAAHFAPATTAAHEILLTVGPGDGPDRLWRLSLSWGGARVDLEEVRGAQEGEALPRTVEAPPGARLEWVAYQVLNAGISEPLGPAQVLELVPSADGSPLEAALR
ncbi:MAG: hypothetical protein FJ299_12725 [Planctomycetes bacterium]|nr:hypothetical protein [Planctomycetota bacterium]